MVLYIDVFQVPRMVLNTEQALEKYFLNQDSCLHGTYSLLNQPGRHITTNCEKCPKPGSVHPGWVREGLRADALVEGPCTVLVEMVRA